MKRPVLINGDQNSPRNRGPRRANNVDAASTPRQQSKGPLRCPYQPAPRHRVPRSFSEGGSSASCGTKPGPSCLFCAFCLFPSPPSLPSLPSPPISFVSHFAFPVSHFAFPVSSPLLLPFLQSALFVQSVQFVLSPILPHAPSTPTHA